MSRHLSGVGLNELLAGNDKRRSKVMWHTTEDARRDAAKQAANQRDDRPSQNCSSFCAAGEPCAITADGNCDAARDLCAVRGADGTNAATSAVLTLALATTATSTTLLAQELG